MASSEAPSRAEIKRAYKESHRPIGVFQVLNRAEQRRLVDSSRNLPASFNKIRMQLQTGSMPQYPALQDDWKRLGPEAFEFEVLEELEPSDVPGWDPTADLQALLELWIEKLDPFGERGYNRKSLEKLKAAR